MELARIKWALLFLGAIIGIGVTGYTIIESWNLFDSLYMVVITLATVGFAETHPLSLGGRIFTVFLIVVWAAMGIYALRSVIQPIVEGEFKGFCGAIAESPMTDCAGLVFEGFHRTIIDRDPKVGDDVFRVAPNHPGEPSHGP